MLQNFSSEQFQSTEEPLPAATTSGQIKEATDRMIGQLQVIFFNKTQFLKSMLSLHYQIVEGGKPLFCLH